MWQATKRFKANGRGQVRNRIGILFGALTLFWSRQLLGGDTPITEVSHVANPPLHVLVISIPDRKLAVTQDGRVVKVYSVAVGATVSPSPTGAMKIINKVANPTYYHKGRVIPPGKSNPLGNRWMGLSENGYGIHGTNIPSSIGQAASHGCIRMRKQDVEELFSLVQVGDTVEIHGERDQQVSEIFSSPAGIADCRLPIVDCKKNTQPLVASGQSLIPMMVAQAEGN